MVLWAASRTRCAYLLSSAHLPFIFSSLDVLSHPCPGHTPGPPFRSPECLIKAKLMLLHEPSYDNRGTPGYACHT
eukprot:scaffold164287_cov16-Tisochrysis_lutea.AAC.1